MNGKKLTDAVDLISTLLKRYKNPAIMSSFGKDSMVMLDLIERNFDRKLPVIFHREPFFPRKLDFANMVIASKGYTVYDYAPSAVTLIKSGSSMEFVNWYHVGGKKYSYLPTGVVEPVPGEPYLCGLNDIYHKPISSNFAFPWDLVFVGHKSSDKDPAFGDVVLHVDVKQNEGGPDYAFPLRHFTDEDIHTYHKHFKVPINSMRYKSVGEYPNAKFEELSDVHYNNDYYPICTRCIDRDGPASVVCPLTGLEISNISKEVVYTEVEDVEYFGVKK
jgi:hypothetical protein